MEKEHQRKRVVKKTGQAKQNLEEDFDDELVPAAPSYDDFDLELVEEIDEGASGPASLKTELDILKENMSCCSVDGDNEEGTSCDSHKTGCFVKSLTKATVASAPVLDEGFSEISPSPVFSSISQGSVEKQDLFHSLISEGVHVLSSWTSNPTVAKEAGSQYLTLNQKIEEIVTDFVASQTHLDRHELYELLSLYRESRMLLTAALKDYSLMLTQTEKARKSIWVESKVTVTEEGPCLDGKMVKACVEYPLAVYNESGAKDLVDSLRAKQMLIKEKVSLAQSSCELHKLKVEHYFYSVTSRIEETDDALDELKRCINIMFSFLRQPTRDQHCVSVMRHWLSQLISVLIMANRQKEVIFVLNHLLRFPSGVGKWGCSFLQLFETQNDKDFENVVFFLSVLMSRVDHREVFLDDLRRSIQGTLDYEEEEHPWAYLDSEGEEEEGGGGAFLLLSGNDLSSFLDQVDFTSLIDYLLKSNQSNKPSESDVWRTFESLRTLLQVFEKGLKTYASDRYRQFSKKILRILKVLVQSLTDYWQDLLEKSRIQNAVTLSLLQLEFDSLYLSFCKAMKGSGCQGAWQVMSTLSYNCLSYDAIWRLYAQLHDSGQIVRDESVWLSDTEFWPRFEEYLSVLGEAEIFSFLATLTSIALSRNVRGDDFIKLVAWELCEIGFVCAATRDYAWKGSRDLLCTLCCKFPHVVSFLLDRLHGAKASMGKLSLILWKALPLHLWSPTYDDLSLLHQWIVSHGVTSLESHLSRLILSSLSYGRTDVVDRNKQEGIGIIVIEACVKHVPELLPSGGIIGDSVRQVSSLATTFLQGNQTPVQAFQKWSWELLGRLKLHLMDQSPESISWTLANEREAFNLVANFEQDPRLEPVRLAIASRQPQAAYFSLIATSAGHSVPEFCTIGLHHLTLLADHGLADQILDIIHKVTPLFFQCPDSLYSSHEFISIVTQLLTEDRGYIKYAKSFIVTQQMSLHVRRLAALIEEHMQNPRRFGLPSLLPITNLWVETVLCVKNWNTNRNALFIFDVVLRGAFFCETSRQYAKKLFEDLVKMPPETQEDRTLPKLLGMVGPFGAKVLGHPLIPVQSLPDFPWLTWFDLVAYTSLEQQTKSDLWRTFLKALGSGKFRNAEHAFKGSIKQLERESMPFIDLMLFRWIEAFLQLEVGHPLEAAYLQQFFLLYLERTPKTGPMDVTGGLGGKIFSSAHECDLIKTASSRIKNSFETLKAKMTIGSFPSFEDKRQSIYLQSIFEAFSRWIEDDQLMDQTVYIPNLPRSYYPEKLLEVFSRSPIVWLEFVNVSAVREERVALLSFWTDYKLSNPQLTQRPTLPEFELSFDQRIKGRLATMPKPLPPPTPATLKAVLPEFRLEMLAKNKSLASFLLPYLRNLANHAKMFCRKMDQLTALNCSFVELLPLEFREEKKKYHTVQMCDGVVEELEKGRKSKSPCCGGAAILFEYAQSVRNESMVVKLAENREDCDIVLAKLLENLPASFIVSSLALEQSVKFLQHARGRADPSSKKLQDAVNDVGSFLFFFILDFLNGDLKSYPPTARLFATCLESLGQDFISNRPKQSIEIITRLASGGSDRTEFLAPHFSPLGPADQDSSSDVFVESYRLCLDLLFDKHLVLFSLVTKFDVKSWLVNYRPTCALQFELLRVFYLAFEKFGQKPDDDSRMNFEVVRRHCRLILLNEFPLHYIPCLRLLIEASSSQSIAVDICNDFLFAFFDGVLDFGRQVGKGFPHDAVDRFCGEQKRIGLKEVLESVDTLVRHFSAERQNHGLYGLYARYRPYIEPISTFVYAVGRIMCLTTIQVNRTTPPQLLLEKLWPLLRDLYSPWLSTYSANFARQSSASWIQNLADDRLRLLPWISTDAPLGGKLMNGFLEIFRLLVELLPADQGIMSYVFLYYLENICHPGVRSHVSDVYHSGFSTLPWDRYSPTQGDLELMVQISNINLPDTQRFFAHLLTQVNWKGFLAQQMNFNGPQALSRSLAMMLHFVIRLSSERLLRGEHKEKFLTLLSDLGRYPWSLLDLRLVNDVSHWLLSVIDPWVALTPNECHDIDKALWRLFAAVTTMVRVEDALPVEAFAKRQLYIHCWSRLATTASTKSPKLITERDGAVAATIKDTLDMAEAAAIANTTNEESRVVELSAILSDFFVIMKDVSEVAQISSVVTRRWLSSRSQGHFALIATLSCASGASIQIQFLAEILESALEAQFENRGDTKLSSTTWEGLLPVVQLPDGLRIGPFIDSSIEKSCFLCLFVHISKKVDFSSGLEDLYTVLNVYCKWLRNVNVTEVSEPKFFLLWSQILEVLRKIADLEFGPSSDILADYVSDLSEQFAALCETQSSWNPFSRFRFTRSTFSPRGRTVAHLLFYFSAKKLEKSCQEKAVPSVVFERFSVITRIWGDKVTQLKSNKGHSEFMASVKDAMQIIDNDSTSFTEWKAFWAVATRSFKNRYLAVV